MKSKKSKSSDLLGEALINNQRIKLKKLIQLIKDFKSDPNTSIAEFALKENIIDKESLLKYIDIETKKSKIYDQNIESLKNLPNAEKWSKLIYFENIGEILLRKKILKIEQLIDALKEKEEKKNIPLEKILLSKSLVTHKDIYEALEFMNNQKQIVESSYMELISIES
ncbi:MAG: hypothetical protein ACK4IX_04480 [Candidatus Sericytochromatia bacterium]